MDQKIQDIYKKIGKLHSENPESTPERNELMKSFWQHHVVPVVDLSVQMAEDYEADKELVFAGALLHDIALVWGKEPHDELGAIEAKRILLENGFEQDFANKVSEIVLKHRCKKFEPETLEEKIVASADAMAHFMPSYYLGIAVVAKEDYPSLVDDTLYKLEKDYEKKIFFEKEKKLLKERMKNFKMWFY